MGDPHGQSEFEIVGHSLGIIGAGGAVKVFPGWTSETDGSVAPA